MRVGDLVKVYDFSRRARTLLAESEPEAVKRYQVGLVLQRDPNSTKTWLIRITWNPSGAQVQEWYNSDRIEVVNG